MYISTIAINVILILMMMAGVHPHATGSTIEIDQNQLQLFPTSHQTGEATTSTNLSDLHVIRLRGSFDAGSTPLKHYDYFEESSTIASATTTAEVEVIIVVVNTTTTPSPFVVDKSERSSAIPADVFSFLSDGDSDRGKPSNTDHSIINNNSDVDAIQRNFSELQAGLPSSFSNSTYNFSDTEVSSQLTIQRNLNYNEYFDKDYSDPEDNYPVDPYSNDDRVYKQGRVTSDERDGENKERVNGRAYKYEYNYQTGDQYDGDEVVGGEIANNQNSEDRSKEIDYRASRDGDGERHAANRGGGADISYAIDEDHFEGGQEEGNDEGDLKDYQGKDNGTITRHQANRGAATDARKSTGHLHKVTAAKPEIESDRGDDVATYLHGGKTDIDQSIDKSVTEDAGEADDHDDDNGDADDGDEDDGLNEVEDNDGDDKHDYGAWKRQRIKMKHDMPDKQENDYEELDEGDDDDHGAAADDDNDEGHKTKAWYAKELSEQMSITGRDYRPGFANDLSNVKDLMIPRKASLGAFSWSEYHHHPTSKHAILLFSILAAFTLLSISIVLLISYRRRLMNYMSCRSAWCVAGRTRLKKKEFGSEESNTLLSNFQV